MSTETIGLVRDGSVEGGAGIWRWGEEGDYIPIAIPLSHHQNDPCIKIGSDESHFKFSFIVRDRVTRTVSTDHDLFEEKGELKRMQTVVLPRLLPLLIAAHLNAEVILSDGVTAV